MDDQEEGSRLLETPNAQQNYRLWKPVCKLKEEMRALLNIITLALDELHSSITTPTKRM